MSGVVDGIYLKIRENELYRGKLKLKKIGMDYIVKNITKSCWSYNIQYEVFLKTSNMLVIKLAGREETVLFKYHKKDKVLLSDYNNFLYYLDNCNIKRGVYITTGVFEENINKDLRSILNKRVKRIDGIKLIKKQLRTDKLSFLEYLPQ